MPVRHNAVFLENSKENQILLKVIEQFVVYGYPAISTIRDLIYKKGFARITGKKTAIQSNTMIEEKLGDKGILCLEDIIHEIYTVGQNFEDVMKFLCPFLLSSPRDGWKKKVSVPYKRVYQCRREHLMCVSSFYDLLADGRLCDMFPTGCSKLNG
uniref:60S ribosomal protein L7 n=1 Tax=Glossina brevipalpis TaxID=37001 RepID=A0A1A9WKV8_9MUSC